MKRLLILPISFVLLLLFQNCTRPGIFAEDLLSAGSTKMATQSDSGNGQGYEGKPIGSYVRMIPSQKCKNSEIQEFGKLDISAGVNTLLQTEPRSCAAEGKTVPDLEFVYSSNQNIAVGVNDGLYINEVWRKSNPEKIVEGWCHEKKNANTAYGNRDFLFSYREGDLTVDGSLWSLNAFSTISFKRKVKNQIVSYVSDNLKITISSNKAPSSVSYLDGFWESSGPDIPSRGDLQCRLGYRLDGVLWPSKPIFGLDFKLAQFVNQGNSAVLQIQDNATVSSLQRWELATGKMTALTPKLESPGDGSLVSTAISKDEKYVFYQAKIFGSAGSSYLSSKLDGGGSVSLSQATYQGPGRYRFQAYDSKTGKVFFTEPSSKAGFSSQSGFLRANHAEGGQYQKIVDEVNENDATTELFLNESQSEVYYAKNPFSYSDKAWYRINLTDMISASLCPYPYKLYPGASHLLGTDYTQRYLFLGDNVAEGNSSRLLLMDKETGSIKQIGEPGTETGGGSPDGRYIVLSSNSLADETNYSIYDLQTNTATAFALGHKTVERGFDWTSYSWMMYTPDSKKLIYSMVYNVSEGLQLYLSDPLGQNEQKLSLQGLKNVIVVAWLSELGQVLYRAQSGDGSEAFYLVSPNTLLTTKVEGFKGLAPKLVAGTNFLTKLKFVQDRIFFKLDSDGDGLQELFVLYFDGRGLQQLNDRFVEYGGVSDFSVIDAHRVIFQTNKNGKNMMFLWQEPHWD